MPKEGFLLPYEEIPSVESYPAHFSSPLMISQITTDFLSLLVTVISCCLTGRSITKVNRNKVLCFCGLRQGYYSSGDIVLNV